MKNRQEDVLAKVVPQSRRTVAERRGVRASDRREQKGKGRTKLSPVVAAARVSTWILVYLSVVPCLAAEDPLLDFVAAGTEANASLIRTLSARVRYEMREIRRSGKQPEDWEETNVDLTDFTLFDDLFAGP